MRITKLLNITVLSLVSFAIPLTGHCQTYTLSTPITGSMTMSVQDLNGPAGNGGGFNLTFNNLTETVYLDPVAQTIRQVGTISVTASAPSISFQETQLVPGQFPNPPQNITGNVTVTLAPTGDVLSFDTGAQAVTWNSSKGAYTFDGDLLNFKNNFTGSYSLVTGGQTYNGSFTYGLSLGDSWSGFTFNTVATAGYPNSLTLSGLGLQFPPAITFAASPNPAADVVAANGFQMKLSVGAERSVTGNSNGENFQWTSPGTITATLVPEPTSLSLLAFGMFGIAFLRRRSS